MNQQKIVITQQEQSKVIMGSNPSKSQQLQNMFPDYKIMPELSLHPSNIYQLIFVRKLKNNQIYTIKESAQENKDINRQVQNVVTCFQSRKIDNVYYSLYEWIPMSLTRYIDAYPHCVNKAFGFYVMQTLIKVYSLLWKLCQGVGLDITYENIKVLKSAQGKPILKVLPPYITANQFNGKRTVRNEVKHLGDALFIAFQGRQKQIGPDIMSFIVLKLKDCRQPTTSNLWVTLEQEAKNLSVAPSTTINEINNMKYLKEQRSVSPIPQERVLFHKQPGSEKQLSPFGRQSEYSPHISRVVTISPIRKEVAHLPNQVYQEYRYRQQVSPLKRNEATFIPIQNQFHVSSPYLANKVPLQRQNMSPNFQLHRNFNQNIQPRSIRNLSPHQINGERNQNLGQQYRNQNRNYPCIFKYAPTGLRMDQSGNKNIGLNSKTQYKQRRFLPQNKLKQNPIIKDEKKQEEQIKINKSVVCYPLFQPSSRDNLQIRPKIGIPSLQYQLKSKQDKYESQQLPKQKQSCKSSLNLFNSGQNFVEKHLIIKNQDQPNVPAKQLLGSSIQSHKDRQYSSFGLTVSEDSENDTFDGNYEGAFHTNYPNVRHGFGKLTFISGGVYQGNFSWNKMNGWGKLFYSSGRLAYQGYWKNGKFEGYGKLFNEFPVYIDTFDFKDFSLLQSKNDEGFWKFFQGNMKNDMKQGHGILVLQNGQKYDGEFHHDMVHGNGIFFGKKETIEGVWQRNKLIKIVNLS